MFKIIDNKGFYITFANGYTVSVQWGRGNYGDNYNMSSEKVRDISSSVVEVAVWDRDNKWIEFSNGSEVIGYQTVSEVLAIFNEIASLHPAPHHHENVI